MMKQIFTLFLLAALLFCSGCVPAEQEEAQDRTVTGTNILFSEEEITGGTLTGGKTKLEDIGGKTPGADKPTLTGKEDRNGDYSLPEIGDRPDPGVIPLPEPVEPTTETEEK